MRISNMALGGHASGNSYIFCGGCLCGSVRFEATGTALSHHSLPLFGLSAKQWCSVRHVGIISSERVSVHQWRGQRAIEDQFHIIRIGTSSWANPEFVRDWYPPKLPAAARMSWYARWSDVRLEGSVYFVCQRAETGISGMKFVRPVIFGLQRSGQIDMQNVGRRR